MAEPVRILCVDRRDDRLRFLERVLAGRGHEILTAPSGREALSAMEGKGAVHVVFAGYPSPTAEEEAFLHEARARWPEMVRIAYSERADGADIASAMRAGEVYRFLSDPGDEKGARDAAENALDRHRLVQALKGADEEVLRAVAQEVELRDAYTRGHCDRVAEYARKIGTALGLPGETMRSLRHGGWLHDCGKIGVPEGVLNRPGKLLPEELEVVRNHPAWGAGIARLAGLPPEVVDILLHHHERFDGNGYPAGMKGREIPLAARIVALADTYDAVTVDRPYARRYEPEEAMRVVGVLRGAAFDPEIVDALFDASKDGGGISP